jgi:hypothetical protein
MNFKLCNLSVYSPNAPFPPKKNEMVQSNIAEIKCNIAEINDLKNNFLHIKKQQQYEEKPV